MKTAIPITTYTWLCFVALAAAPALAFAETEAEIITRLHLAAKYHATEQVRTTDGAYCDLVTAMEAIEVDFAGGLGHNEKWAEAIGQALYYGIALKKRPAVLLLTSGAEGDKEGEDRHIARCRAVCEKYGIKLYLESIRTEKSRPKTKVTGVSQP